MSDIDSAIEQLHRELARYAVITQQEPADLVQEQDPARRWARLQVAHAAIALATSLLSADNPDVAHALTESLQQLNEDGPLAQSTPSPTRLETVTLGRKPHLRFLGKTLTLCHRPARSIQPLGIRPTPNTMCKNCLAKAKTLELLCSSCREPLIIPSPEPGLCQRCYLKRQCLTMNT